MNKSWIKSKKKLPKHCELVFCAWLDVQSESFQYYVGWYNADEKEWFLTDFGYTSDVAFWMPIPKLDMSDYEESQEDLRKEKAEITELRDKLKELCANLLALKETDDLISRLDEIQEKVKELF